MKRILEYTEHNLVYMIVLLGVMILAAVFWNLYLREKRVARKAEEKLRGGEKFYSAFENDKKTAYVFIREKNRKVLYATPDFLEGSGFLIPSMIRSVRTICSLLEKGAAILYLKPKVARKISTNMTANIRSCFKKEKRAFWRYSTENAWRIYDTGKCEVYRRGSFYRMQLAYRYHFRRKC